MHNTILRMFIMIDYSVILVFHKFHLKGQTITLSKIYFTKLNQTFCVHYYRMNQYLFTSGQTTVIFLHGPGQSYLNKTYRNVLRDYILTWALYTVHKFKNNCDIKCIKLIIVWKNVKFFFDFTNISWETISDKLKVKLAFF